MSYEFLTTFEHKGVTIGLISNGRFVPMLNDKAGAPLNSLQLAEDHIDREQAKTKTKRIRYDIPCLVLGSATKFAGSKYHRAIYRGINITSGDAMVTIDGRKTTVKRYNIYRLPKDWDEFEAKLEAHRTAIRVVNEFDSYVNNFKVPVPGIRYSDGVDEVSEKEKVLAETLSG